MAIEVTIVSPTISFQSTGKIIGQLVFVGAGCGCFHLRVARFLSFRENIVKVEALMCGLKGLAIKASGERRKI